MMCEVQAHHWSPLFDLSRLSSWKCYLFLTQKLLFQKRSVSSPKPPRFCRVISEIIQGVTENQDLDGFSRMFQDDVIMDHSWWLTSSCQVYVDFHLSGCFQSAEMPKTIRSGVALKPDWNPQTNADMSIGYKIVGQNIPHRVKFIEIFDLMCSAEAFRPDQCGNMATPPMKVHCQIPIQYRETTPNTPTCWLALSPLGASV